MCPALALQSGSGISVPAGRLEYIKSLSNRVRFSPSAYIHLVASISRPLKSDPEITKASFFRRPTSRNALSQGAPEARSKIRQELCINDGLSLDVKGLDAKDLVARDGLPAKYRRTADPFSET